MLLLPQGQSEPAKAPCLSGVFFFLPRSITVQSGAMDMHSAWLWYGSLAHACMFALSCSALPDMLDVFAVHVLSGPRICSLYALYMLHAYSACVPTGGLLTVEVRWRLVTVVGHGLGSLSPHWAGLAFFGGPHCNTT